jgi:glycosyltransferase involved in cell wall biosynthesis
MLPSIAVLIPCLNEEATISEVVRSFSLELPDAKVYVFDNNSTDNSVAQATATGASVRHVLARGKGNVVREMFRQIDADVYVMVDGDMTYPPNVVRELIRPILSGQAHMSVGDRLSSFSYAQQNTRPFHTFGNRLVVLLINLLFNAECKDILSGYRAFSRTFVESTSLVSSGFEVETELTLHCLDKKLSYIEIPIDYFERPSGSSSKLHTLKDGLRIIRTVGRLFKDYRPLLFFTVLSFLALCASLVSGGIVVLEFFTTSYITHIPLAILAAASGLVSILLFCSGLILDSVTRQHKTLFELNIAKSSRSNHDQ